MLSIKQLREERNWSQTELAEKLEVSLRTVQNYEADQSKIPLNKLHNIYKILNVNLSNEMFVADIQDLTGYYLPEVSASAGLETSINNDELKKIPVTIPGWEKDIIFINVFGDSMYPKYNSGEVIGVKYVEFQYLNYGYPYVVVFNDGEVFIKIIQPGKDEDHLVLESVNAFYKPKEFHKSLIKSFYSIKGVIKKEMM